MPMITADPRHRDVLDVLRDIDDPEMPISIVDLGLVEAINRDENERGRVEIDILPTFVGCPALDMIRDEIVEKVSALDDVETVEVRFLFDPAWSVDRITDAGRASLAAHGVTVPERGGGACGSGSGGGTAAGAPHVITTLRTSAVPCPFCGSTNTRLDSPFGPTRCRMIYYCDACRNGFEHMKRV